jgi:hypothetical protein
VLKRAETPTAAAPSTRFALDVPGVRFGGFGGFVGWEALFCDVHHIANAAAALSEPIHTREDSDGQVGSCC